MAREVLDAFNSAFNILRRVKMKLTIKKIIFIFFCAQTLLAFGQEDKDIEAGPLFAEFPLTLSSGYRFEAAGPLYYSQQSDSQWQWALPPFFCYTRTADVDWTEMDFLYPIASYRRFGPEYKLQLVEFFSFSGAEEFSLTDHVRRFTLFPIYFQQRSANTNLDYTALVPFYGHLEDRLFHNDIKFVMFPLYSETRKKDVVTDNYVYPIFDLRHGDHLTGWQFWPVAGVEHKTPTLSTNNLDEVETVGGYDKFFAAFPFYFKSRTGLGTTNEETSLTVVPFYSRVRSPARDETSYGWPLGYNVIDDREQKYVEHDVFWPLFVKARGSKTVTRVFPFYSRAHNADLESDFYLWPIYKFNRLKANPLERRRTRILFFLYSDTVETNKQSGESLHRNDFWPFYGYHREIDGKERLQILAVLEPFFPNNRSITREYAQVFSLWRWEKNPKTGAASQSLLWNFYRREATAHSKKISLLFGLFQYQSGPEGWRWRLCHATMAKERVRAVAPKS
jgi:hypothetical protein